ncbi:MAG: ribosomal-processing cysteine protease Prp, partial [Acholeplasmataceae bacterium]
MITILVKRQNQSLILDIQGHALFAPKGDDIVCAGVSTASIMTANLFGQVTPTTSHLSDGRLTVTVHTFLSSHQYILDVFKKAMDDIAASYPGYVILKESE